MVRGKHDIYANTVDHRHAQRSDVPHAGGARNRARPAVRQNSGVCVHRKTCPSRQVSGGLSIIVSGEVDVTRQDSSGQDTPIVTYGPGAFLGELGELADRPALVNATSRGPVEALIIHQMSGRDRTRTR